MIVCDGIKEETWKIRIKEVKYQRKLIQDQDGSMILIWNYRRSFRNAQII